jgi:hypothetical protein
MFTPVVVDGTVAFPFPFTDPLAGRSYGFDAAEAATCLDDEAGMAFDVWYTEKICELDHGKYTGKATWPNFYLFPPICFRFYPTARRTWVWTFRVLAVAAFQPSI